jgi:hypothetical protein
VSRPGSALNNHHLLAPTIIPRPIKYETPISSPNTQSNGYGLPVVADNFDLGQFGDLGTLPWGPDDAHFDLYEVDYGNGGVYDM